MARLPLTLAAAARLAAAVAHQPRTERAAEPVGQEVC